MSFKAIESTLSISRISTYRNEVVAKKGVSCDNSILSLYEWNANLSSSLLFPLHVYEVTLRNAISDAISLRYGDRWPVNPAFQNSLPQHYKTELTKVVGQNFQGLGKVLPELKLSWYEHMLTKRYHNRIWEKHIYTVFPNSIGLPPKELRELIKNACLIVRRIRNRIAHHEPIFNQNTLVDIYPKIETMVNMRCQATRDWLCKTEKITEQLANPAL